MAPFEALLIPMYLVFRQANLLNQLPALIITYFIFTLPFTIWALRGFIDGIPIDLEESAMVDGAQPVRGVPPRRAAAARAGPRRDLDLRLHHGLERVPLRLRADARHRRTSRCRSGSSTFRTAFGTDWGGTMAASTLFTLPVLVFFLLIQNRMVGGVTAGAVKG